MHASIVGIESLLLVAALVALLARRARVPYAVGLVLAGIALAAIPISPQLDLTKELIFTAFLPPLVFEAAIHIRWRELRQDLLVIGLFATLGVMLSAGVTTLGMHYLAGWDWTTAALFGTLIAATDPVSVIATLKDAAVHGRIRLLMESESLFNDSTAAIAFGIALTIASGGNISAPMIALNVLANFAGGILSGIVVAGAVLLLAGRTTDHLVEITLTTVAAYGSFVLAEDLGVSGVMASICAGLLIGNLGKRGAISQRGHDAVDSFWEYAAFVVNSLIFLLIGIQEAYRGFMGVALTSLIGVAVVALGRAVAIYPLASLFSRVPRRRISLRHQHVLFWGGLRGALALALALGLPAELPNREDIITVAYAVVAFSIFAQGLTMTPLLHVLGVVPKAGTPQRSDNA